jgi:hypothetical protein
MAFQTMDRLRGSRLAYLVGHSAARKALVLDNVAKYTDCFYVHKYILSLELLMFKSYTMTFILG